MKKDKPWSVSYTHLDVYKRQIHVPPTILRLVYKIKGVERTCLITDALACAASEDVYKRQDKDQALSVFSQLVDSAGHVIAEAETPVTLHKQSDRTVEQDLIVNQPARCV